jgi:glycosyltransferase involved in cell wall biosynthesis
MSESEEDEPPLSRLTVCVSTTSKVLHGKRQGLTITTKLLIDFLAKRVGTLIAIDHPFPDDPDVSPLSEVYQDGRLLKKNAISLPRGLSKGAGFQRSASRSQLYYLFKLLDFVSSCVFVLRARRRVHLYIGVESVNTIAGLFLRRLGVVERVVYYSFDFKPRIYSSALPNAFFLALDKLCFSRADAVWNATEELRESRNKLWGEKNVRQLTIPGLNPPPIPSNFGNLREHSVVYLGSIGESSGIQLVILGMPSILEKVPDLVFHVIGTGHYVQELRRLSRENHTEGHVLFHGYLSDERAAEILLRCRAGVAPYLEGPVSSEMRYLDSSKVKYYAYYGVPTVLANTVPKSARLINDFRAGFVVEPEAAAFADAVARLLTNDELFNSRVEGCLELTDSFNSEKHYERALEETLSLLKR